MDIKEFRAHIAELEPSEFCRRHLFGDAPWLFEPDNPKKPECEYSDFRQIIAESFQLGITAENVMLVGSGYFGFSTNPNKFPNKFSNSSDLDIIIISSKLYGSVWAEFRKLYYSGYHWVADRHSKDVFRHFFVLANSHYPNSAYIRETILRFDNTKRDLELKTGITRPLKYRVYAQLQSAVDYHAYGISKIKERDPDGNA